MDASAYVIANVILSATLRARLSCLLRSKAVQYDFHNCRSRVAIDGLHH